MPSDRADYPENWEEISRYIRQVRAGNRCEWIEDDGTRCTALDWHWNANGNRIVLACCHIDHDTQNNDFSNLAAWCQRHHMMHDLAHHRRVTAENRRDAQRQAGQLDLFDIE